MTDAPGSEALDSVGLGFVGLGQIGAPMARRLADWPGGLRVYDVEPGAVHALAEAGAEAAGSVEEVAEHADLVSVMVRDDAQVHEVLAALLRAARPGTIVAVHSTIHPDTAVELADRAGRHGVELLDAPVSGGAMGATEGRLAILVGGSEEAFERGRAPFERMGELVVRLGPVGAGTRAKLARNLLHFVAFAAVTEAQRLAEAAGIDLRRLGEVVRHTDALTGGPGAIMLRDTAAPLAPDDGWVPVLEHVRDLGEKDLSLAVELGERLRVDTPLARLALERLGPGLGLPGRQVAHG